MLLNIAINIGSPYIVSDRSVPTSNVVTGTITDMKLAVLHLCSVATEQCLGMVLLLGWPHVAGDTSGAYWGLKKSSSKALHFPIGNG